MSGSRQKKVAEAIRAAAADYLTKNLANTTPGFITVSKVKMSPDLKLANVYFSIFGNDKAIEDSFKVVVKHMGRFRYHIGQEVIMKYVPELRFFLDDTMAYTAKINSMLKDLE